MHGKAGQLLGCLLQLIVKNEFAQRDGCAHENLDVFARQVNKMQVKVLQLESLGDRVTSLAALKPNEIKVGAGGALVSSQQLAPHQLLKIIRTPNGELNKQPKLFTSLKI